MAKVGEQATAVEDFPSLLWRRSYLKIHRYSKIDLDPDLIQCKFAKFFDLQHESQKVPASTEQRSSLPNGTHNRTPGIPSTSERRPGTPGTTGTLSTSERIPGTPGTSRNESQLFADSQVGGLILILRYNVI